MVVSLYSMSSVIITIGRRENFAHCTVRTYLHILSIFFFFSPAIDVTICFLCMQ